MVIKYLLSSLMLLLSCSSVASNILQFEGKAYNPETSQLIYTEKHRITLDDNGEYVEGVVEYVNAEGDVFAAKNISYDASPVAPSFTFYDYRTNHQVEVGRDNQKISLLSKQGSDEKRDLVDISSEEKVVVDAGFDRFIYYNWDKLIDQKGASFAFLAISRAMLVDLDINETSKDGETITYKVQPSNFILSLLVDPIELTYDAKTQRLLRFEGLTNIPKSLNGSVQDENYVAVIQYHYAQ